MVENIKIRKLIHKQIIIDTSVLIKLIFEEEDSDLVRKIMLLNERMELSLLATPLIFFEFLNALSKTLKNQKLVEEGLKKFFNFKIGVIDAKYGYLQQAIATTCNNEKVSYYDASYHALAKDIKGIFLTADKKYYEIMKSEGNILLLSRLAQ